MAPPRGEAFTPADRAGDLALDPQRLAAERIELVRTRADGAELTVPEAFCFQLGRASASAPYRAALSRLVRLGMGEGARLEQGLLVIEVRARVCRPTTRATARLASQS